MSDLEFALRVKADLDDARQELRGFAADLQGITGASTKTAGGLDKVNNASNKATKSTKAVADAAKEAAGGLKQEERALDAVDKAAQRASKSTNDLQRATNRAGRQLVSGNVSGAATTAVQAGARSLLLSAPAATLAVGGLAAAITASLVAMAQGQAEGRAYDAALIATGGYAGKTREELAELAVELDNLKGVTAGQAAAAIAAIAGSGKFAGEQFEIATRASVQWAADTGAAVDETVAKFELIKKDPVAALLELTEKERFLTQEQLARIRVLIEEGREQEAATEAFRIYSDMLAERGPRIAETLSPIEKLWKDIKHAAAEAWDAMVGMGRSDFATTMRQRVGEISDALPWWLGPSGILKGGMAMDRRYNSGPDQGPAPAATDNLVDPAAERAAEEARKEWQRQTERHLSDRLRMEKEITKVREVGLKAGKSEAEIEQQVAAIRKTYADREAKKGRGGSKLTDTQRAQQSADRELANLTRQATLLGELEDGEKRVTEEARIRYETTEGSYKLASEAIKQQMLEQAKLIDATRAAHEEEKKRQQEFKETEHTYERLRDTLRTPAEAAVATATQQIEELNKALDAGIIKAPEYREALSRIIGAGGPMPMLEQPWQDFTGLGFEQNRLDEFAKQLRDFFNVRTQIIAEGRAKGQEAEEYWRQQELQLEAEHQSRLSDLQRARHQLAVASTQSMFDSMAEIARHGAGEQSKAYQILFAISKGFAVAQAAVALAQNVAEASKAGFPQNLPLIAMAFAQGAQIASLLSAASYSGASGYATGGRIHGSGTGTSDSVPIWASKDEYMVRAVSARQPGAYPFLEDFNRRGMAAVYDRAAGRFAVGGSIGQDAVTTSNPSYNTPAQGALSPSVLNQMRLYLYQDMDALRSAVLNHPATEKYMVATIGQNGNAVRAEWG